MVLPSSSSSGRLTRKRAGSIDIEQANRQKFENLSLSTPSSAGLTSNSDGRDYICLCAPAPKVPRPRNGESNHLLFFLSVFFPKPTNALLLHIRHRTPGPLRPGVTWSLDLDTRAAGLNHCHCLLFSSTFFVLLVLVLRSKRRERMYHLEKQCANTTNSPSIYFVPSTSPSGGYGREPRSSQSRGVQDHRRAMEERGRGREGLLEEPGGGGETASSATIPRLPVYPPPRRTRFWKILHFIGGWRKVPQVRRSLYRHPENTLSPLSSRSNLRRRSLRPPQLESWRRGLFRASGAWRLGSEPGATAIWFLA